MLSIRVLRRIYQLAAVHGTMKRQFDTWCHTIEINHTKLSTWKEGTDWVLTFGNVLSVRWDDMGVYLGRYHKGDAQDAEDLLAMMEEQLSEEN